MTPAWKAWPALGLVWMLAAIACIHVFGISTEPVADDSYFAGMLAKYTLSDYLVHRYHTWTGRLPIEALLVVVVHHPWIWRVGNALMLVLLCHASGRLARVGTGLSRTGATVLAFALVLALTPQIIFESAWWLTGSLNYLWPVALGLWSLVPLVEGARYRTMARIGFCLAATLAAYCDQLALVLAPLSLGLLAWPIRQRRWQGWDLAQVALLCANAVFALSAPGNAQRFLEEQGMRFPNFADQDVVEKLRIGLGLIARVMTDPRSYLIAEVGAIALLLLWRGPLARGLKALLLAVVGISLLQYVLFLPHVPGDPLHQLVPVRLDGDAVLAARSYLVTAWSLFAVGCLVIACACGFWHRLDEAGRMAGVLLIGLASLGMLGFSPTAYASGMRIAFLCMMAFVIVGVRMIARVPQVYGAWATRAVLAVVVLLASWRATRIVLY